MSTATETTTDDKTRERARHPQKTGNKRQLVPGKTAERRRNAYRGVADRDSDGPGHRRHAVHAGSNNRPSGPYDHKATLRRGLCYFLSYDDCRLEFFRGQEVDVSVEEAAHLGGQTARITIRDGARELSKPIYLFDVLDQDGEPIEREKLRARRRTVPTGDRFEAARRARQEDELRELEEDF